MLSILVFTPLSLLNLPDEFTGTVVPLTSVTQVDEYLTAAIGDAAQRHLQANAKLPNRLDITVFFESGGYDIHPSISTDTCPFDLDDIGFSNAGIPRLSHTDT